MCSTKSMIVDLTYMGEKKRKGSRGSDSTASKVMMDCLVLKDQNRKAEAETEKLMESLEKMTKSLKQKDIESRNNKFKLGQISGILEECETDMMEQNKKVMILEVRTDNITAVHEAQQEY